MLIRQQRSSHFHSYPFNHNRSFSFRSRYKSQCIVFAIILTLILIISQRSYIFQFLHFLWIQPTINHILSEYERQIQVHSTSKPPIQKSSKGVIVSMHSGSKFEWSGSNMFRQNKMLYALRHEYSFYLDKPLHLRGHPASYKDARFDKPWILDFYLNQHPESEYVLWIDGDAMFIDLGLSIDRQFHRIVEDDDNQNIQIIVGSDHNGINSGVVLMRNTEWTRNFVRFWSHWNIQRDEALWKWHDQSQLVEMINQNVMDCNKHILVLPRTKTSFLQKYKASQCQWIVHHPNSNGLQLIAHGVNDQKYLIPSIHSLGSAVHVNHRKYVHD